MAESPQERMQICNGDEGHRGEATSWGSAHTGCHTSEGPGDAPRRKGQWEVIRGHLFPVGPRRRKWAGMS